MVSSVFGFGIRLSNVLCAGIRTWTRIGSLFTRTGVTCARDAGGIFAIPLPGLATLSRSCKEPPVWLRVSLFRLGGP